MQTTPFVWQLGHNTFVRPKGGRLEPPRKGPPSWAYGEGGVSTWVSLCGHDYGAWPTINMLQGVITSKQWHFTLGHGDQLPSCAYPADGESFGLRVVSRSITSGAANAS